MAIPFSGSSVVLSFLCSGYPRRETDVHYDETCLHGYPLFKTIQPTAWSRKRDLHGMDPMQAPLAALCRYQSQEFALRPFSASRFLGVVPTRTVAKSVLCSQFLKAVCEQAVDIDGIAEHLHRTQAPSRLILSKVDTLNKLIPQQFVDYKAFKLNWPTPSNSWLKLA